MLLKATEDEGGVAGAVRFPAEVGGREGAAAAAQLELLVGMAIRRAASGEMGTL